MVTELDISAGRVRDCGARKLRPGTGVKLQKQIDVITQFIFVVAVAELELEIEVVYHLMKMVLVQLEYELMSCIHPEW